MNKLVYFAIGAVLLAGCAKTAWVHPEYTETRFTQDHQSCQYTINLAQASAMGGRSTSQAILNVGVRYDLMNQCMASKGWTLERREG